MSDDLIERLRREAALQSEWHEWELNRGPAPAAMDMSRTAKLLREAAAELSRLREMTTWRPWNELDASKRQHIIDTVDFWEGSNAGQIAVGAYTAIGDVLFPPPGDKP